jgi:hypothetical protein
MKTLIVMFIYLFFLQETNAQILLASSKKSLKMSVEVVKRGLLELNSVSKNNFFTPKDSVDFKLDIAQIAKLIHRDSIYTQVEEEAYFMEGRSKTNDYILKNIPKNHKRKGTVVVIKLIIENFGGISHPHVLISGNDEKLANDILKIVKNMKVWTPAKIFGLDVSSYHTLTLQY